MAEEEPPNDVDQNSTDPADPAKNLESTDPPSSEPAPEKAAAPDSASSAKSEPEEASADAAVAAKSPPTSAPAEAQSDPSAPDVTGSTKLAQVSDNATEVAEKAADSLPGETPSKPPSGAATAPPPEDGGGEVQAKSESTAPAEDGTKDKGVAPESVEVSPEPKSSSQSGSKTSSKVIIVAGSASKSKSGSTTDIAAHPSTEANKEHNSPANAAEAKAATPPESKKASRASLAAGSGTGSKQGSVVTITEGKAPNSGRASRLSISVASQASASRRLSSAKKETRVDNSSMTERLYSNQINSGKHNKLTSVVFDKYGNKKLVHPGSVGRCHTVDISLAGMARTQRPMPQERCRKGEHNCFTKKGGRHYRSASSVTSFGQYPDFMKMNKLNEFVAASIIEKLRLKGLALPLHDYHGRSLPSSILAELVMQPAKKKVTDRYYFGYVPPPNRPRFNAAFRHYMQQFKERHTHAESDINYGVALEHVRVLADLQENDHPLSMTLAEVVRAQEEPGFGTRQFRRPQSAAI